MAVTSITICGISGRRPAVRWMRMNVIGLKSKRTVLLIVRGLLMGLVRLGMHLMSLIVVLVNLTTCRMMRFVIVCSDTGMTKTILSIWSNFVMMKLRVCKTLLTAIWTSLRSWSVRMGEGMSIQRSGLLEENSTYVRMADVTDVIGILPILLVVVAKRLIVLLPITLLRQTISVSRFVPGVKETTGMP